MTKEEFKQSVLARLEKASAKVSELTENLLDIFDADAKDCLAELVAEKKIAISSDSIVSKV